MAGLKPGPWRMPAEWEPHEATWIGWPHERTDWPGKFAPIRWVYAEIVRHLAGGEIVRILVEDLAHREKAVRTLEKAGANLDAVEFFECRTNRGWLRDSGPLFVKNAKGRVRITNWKFNAWARYDDWELDNAVPGFIAERLGMARVTPPVALEGGAIDVNGQGTLLATEECLLSPVQARNPGVGRARLEAAMARYLGIGKVLWLGRGIAGDDTHGHIDDITRFVCPRRVVTAVEPNRADTNHEPLRENRRRLSSMTDESGQPLEVVTLPMPSPVIFAGQRLPASYANFYIGNRAVLVPVFNDPNDRIALNILSRAFRGRDVIPIYCRDLVLGLGTLHCLTQQQPAPAAGAGSPRSALKPRAAP